ncbi:hypothetical protein SCP_1303110 [Sparassis crispa]|uniref:Uncharacterized protein n=1 Tax=Sparassis crispa TaxID=139825 RepID=A0A401H237_9APHY|nr:hypothetical protein SCP_1303110 [Sparassis crispa]GBE88495.1 hypothetical protein SCP_1303110 [Sparassis crispa]
MPQFPEGEWANVLTGRAVNLDHVFSGRYSTVQEEKHRQKVGEYEITHQNITPAKRVQSVGDWVIAWDMATTATCYAFQHRQTELAEYGKYIMQLLAATADEFWDRILDYDRAICMRVGEHRNLRLMDFDQFIDLKHQFLDYAGAGTGAALRSRGGGAWTAGPVRCHSTELCR